MPSSPAVDVRSASAAVSREFQLNAFELPYILTLPILRQQFVNWAEDWAVYLAGLGKSAVGIGQSVLAIPEVTVQIVQQVLALDFVGAFDTFTSAVRNAVIAIGQPLLDSLIWRNQKLLAAQTALEAAVPKAFIVLAAGAAPTRETATAIFAHVREHLAPFKRVRRLEFADLPKTISGKIRRVELRRIEDERRGANRYDPQARFANEFWAEDCAAGD